ncbi:putative zinc metalloprotease Rip3 [subsurface metagenome]
MLKMSRAFNLGKVFGIPFRLHYTWFIIFILVTVSLSWQVFPALYPGWASLTYWVTGIVTSLLFFASVLAHELAHSLIARINGIPVKSITLFIFGGVAQITREAARPGAELKMAAAGPACSLVIGGLFALVWFFTEGVIEPIAALAFWLAQINVVLAIFNLIPGFPLDGGRVFRSLIWRLTGNYKRSTQIAVRVGQGVGYTFIGLGITAALLSLFGRAPFGLTLFSGLWLTFIGWFLENAASASYHQVKWRDALHGFSASQVMTAVYPAVPPNITVRELVQGYIFTSGHHLFMVADEGRLVGILTLDNIKSVPQPSWEATQVKEVMTPVDKLRVAHPDQDALSILEQMEEDDINQMPVVSGDRVIGLITRDNLIRVLRLRFELGV